MAYEPEESAALCRYHRLRGGQLPFGRRLPKWLKLQSIIPAALIEHMAARGFHPYLLCEEDYEVARCVPLSPAKPPQRLRDAAALEARKQSDVIFSRRDEACL